MIYMLKPVKGKLSEKLKIVKAQIHIGIYETAEKLFYWNRSNYSHLKPMKIRICLNEICNIQRL